MRITLTPETRKTLFKQHKGLREVIWNAEAGQFLNPVDRRAILTAAIG